MSDYVYIIYKKGKQLCRTYGWNTGDYSKLCKTKGALETYLQNSKPTHEYLVVDEVSFRMKRNFDGRMMIVPNVYDVHSRQYLHLNQSKKYVPVRRNIDKLRKDLELELPYIYLAGQEQKEKARKKAREKAKEKREYKKYVESLDYEDLYDLEEDWMDQDKIISSYNPPEESKEDYEDYEY